MPATGWVAEVKAAFTIPQAISEFGLTKGRGGFGPCPHCGEDKRSGTDGRPPCGTKGGGWKCFGCDANGDVIELVAFQVLGKSSREFSKPDWKALRKWCEGNGLCAARDDRSSGSVPKGFSLARVSDVVSGRPRTFGSKSGGDKGSRPKAEPRSRRSKRPDPFAWNENLLAECCDRLWDDASAEPCLAYLRETRGLDDKTIRAFELGAIHIDDERLQIDGEWTSVAGWWVTIPLYTEDDRVVNMRFRRIPTEENHRPKYRVCRGRPLPLFGSKILGNDLGTVILTEGEFDVMAMWQYGWQVSVVSTTAGTDTFEDEWLDLLEDYESFILVYDDDEAGDKGAEKLAEALGEHRCSRAVLPCKDANECLVQGVDVERMERALDRAKPMLGIQLLRVEDYRERVQQLAADPSALFGTPTGSAKLDEVLKGVRAGLWVVTGPSGHGKTSFCHWLFLEQAMVGEPVMLTSFEQRPIGSIQKLVRMQLGGDFTEFSKAEIDQAFDDLGELPIFVLDHYGRLDWELLAQLIRFTKRRHGVRRVLIDHLHFLVDPSEDATPQIEEIVRGLATLSINEDVAIFLIAHPNRMWKSQRKKRPEVSDIKGASAVEQDAHVGLVIWKAPVDEKRKYPGAFVAIDKDRAEFGNAGATVYLAYDPDAGVYADSWWDTPMGAQQRADGA